MGVKIKSRKEITRELRKMNQEKLNKECPESRYCAICGKEEGVQNHHIIKVELLSKFAYYHKVDDLENLYAPTVDLCDYHHKVWHGCTGDTNYIDEDISIDTFYRIVDILGQVDLSLVPEDLYDDYRASYDEMVNAFAFELKERYSFSEEEVDEIQNILMCSHDLSIEEISKLLESNENVEEIKFETNDFFDEDEDENENENENFVDEDEDELE